MYDFLVTKSGNFCYILGITDDKNPMVSGITITLESVPYMWDVFAYSFRRHNEESWVLENVNY